MLLPPRSPAQLATGGARVAGRREHAGAHEPAHRRAGRGRGGLRRDRRRPCGADLLGRPRGQVLLSAATAALVGARSPQGVRERELGEYRLKDIERPERIYQLDVEGLQSSFPPLRTHERSRSTSTSGSSGGSRRTSRARWSGPWRRSARSDPGGVSPTGCRRAVHRLPLVGAPRGHDRRDRSDRPLRLLTSYRRFGCAAVARVTKSARASLKPGWSCGLWP